MSYHGSLTRRVGFASVVFLFCAAHGRRVLERVRHEHSSSHAEHHSPLIGDIALTEFNQSQLDWRTDANDQLKALSMLLASGNSPLVGFQAVHLTPAIHRDAGLPIVAHGPAAAPGRLAGAPQFVEVSEAERKEKLKQLFGKDFQTEEDKVEAEKAAALALKRREEEIELARAPEVKQPREPEPIPEWMQERPDGVQSKRDWDAKRLTAWLQEFGVDMENIIVVPLAEDEREDEDDNRLVLKTSRAVSAGAVLFDVPDRVLLTAKAAFADPAVGPSLRRSAEKDLGPGFETYAMATLLGAERVRRGAVAQELEQDDFKFEAEWKAREASELQNNQYFSAFVQSLDWPEYELYVEPERAQAVNKGAKAIAKLIDPVARTAWYMNTRGKGLFQATADEDVPFTARQALVLAIWMQLNPPPPIGDPDGEARWGGDVLAGPAGRAICPLVNLVIPLPANLGAAREDGSFNAMLGRPSSGKNNTAIRCIAAQDLPAGTIILSDEPGAPGDAKEPIQRNELPLAVGSRIRVVSGSLFGRFGTVLFLRKDNGKPLVRLDGEDSRPIMLPINGVEVLE